MKDLGNWKKIQLGFVDGIMISLQSIVSAAFIESLFQSKCTLTYYLEFNKFTTLCRVSVGIFLLTNIYSLPS